MVDVYDTEGYSSTYQKYRPEYPPQVFQYFVKYLGEKLFPPWSLAVDVACGTGRGTRPLVEYFDHVIGCDVSQSQIAKAIEMGTSEKLSFKVAAFDQLPVSTGSAQLVTCATAVQWFDPIEDFYREVERILCPGGCLVVYGHYFPEGFEVKLPDGRDGREIARLCKEFREPFLQPQYVPPGHDHAENKYRDLRLPFGTQVRNDEFSIRWETTLRDVTEMNRSLTYYREYVKAHPGDPDPMLQLESELERLLDGTPPEQCLVTVHFPIFILMARKPTSV